MARAAIGKPVRVLCWVTTALLTVVALGIPATEPLGLRLLLLVMGALFALPAVYGGTAPTAEYAATASRRARVVGRLRRALMMCGYLLAAMAILAPYLPGQSIAGAHSNFLKIVAAITWVTGFLLRFVRAFYDHYSTDQG